MSFISTSDLLLGQPETDTLTRSWASASLLGVALVAFVVGRYSRTPARTSLPSGKSRLFLSRTPLAAIQLNHPHRCCSLVRK
jgi:hypothetical protein